ncbi:MAG TPA: hypothetical protein VFO80_03975 [Sphingomonas sp.]|nr:hypothetical protein [Sphingomonas sp.]
MRQDTPIFERRGGDLERLARRLSTTAAEGAGFHAGVALTWLESMAAGEDAAKKFEKHGQVL